MHLDIHLHLTSYVNVAPLSHLLGRWASEHHIKLPFNWAWKHHIYVLIIKYTPFRNKRDNLWVWLFYSHFWGIFCQPYRYLSQIFGADGHFEVLNMSKSQLDQKLKAKTQIILFLFFFNFGRKNHENLWLINANFFTIFGHFLAN